MDRFLSTEDKIRDKNSFRLKKVEIQSSISQKKMKMKCHHEMFKKGFNRAWKDLRSYFIECLNDISDHHKCCFSKSSRVPQNPRQPKGESWSV